MGYLERELPTEAVKPSGGSAPVPDPTQLTDQAIAKLKEQLEQYIEGKVDGLTTLIEAETKLTLERFASSERVRLEQKKDTKDAVDAALSAAKEAVKEQTTASERSIAKSETATAKQLEQQSETVGTVTKGLGDKIDDLKERVSRIESIAVGTTAQRIEGRQSNAALYGLIGLVISIAFLALAILGAAGTLKT
jgi:cell division protein ZapA (FtsZ GTPase activity inhibitor)